MKKIVSLALLATTLACSQAGIMGGSEGLHQINAKTLGLWQINLGTGGDMAFSSWALSRGGAFEVENRWGRFEKYAFKDLDFSQSGNLFASIGLFYFLDVGVSLPIYYEYAKSNKLGGSANMWTTGIGDVDLFFKAGLPFASTEIFSMAFLLDIYIPTGSENGGVRPRHAWYLHGLKNTQPFTADDWAFGTGLAFSFDFSKHGAPITWNIATSFVFPSDDNESTTLVYSTGVNWNALSWMTPFMEFSAEMRLQEKGRYEFDPLVDPMLLTPGLRFHLPYDIEFAIGLEIAVRAFVQGFEHGADVAAGNKYPIYYEGDGGVIAKYDYASTPFFAGAALLSISLDAAGNSKDSDRDGVIDLNDLCARTPFGTKVDSNGCPINDFEKWAREKAVADSLARLDSDNDGVPDVKDKCPSTVAGRAVDSVGCMLDFDKDGVPDELDKCPNTPAGVAIGADGCALDYDSDGIPDYLDKCPNTPQGVEIDPTGCAFDRDGDGIPDYRDKCPGTPAGTPVDTLGCLPDFDKDGVPDNLDKCPNTLPGVSVDSKGCPRNKKEDLDRLKKGIQFKTGSARLTQGSYAILNDIAKLMSKITEANLEVQGHTDNLGSETKNLDLSEARAQAVVDYLVKKGISSDRLRAVGYGSEIPIADNDNAAGRAQNRRVELVPFAK